MGEVKNKLVRRMEKKSSLAVGRQAHATPVGVANMVLLFLRRLKARVGEAQGAG